MRIRVTSELLKAEYEQKGILNIFSSTFLYVSDEAQKEQDSFSSIRSKAIVPASF